MTEVVIAGTGLNGLMLACELGLAGIRPVILDPMPGPHPHPRVNRIVGQVVRRSTLSAPTVAPVRHETSPASNFPECRRMTSSSGWGSTYCRQTNGSTRLAGRSTNPGPIAFQPCGFIELSVALRANKVGFGGALAPAHIVSSRKSGPRGACRSFIDHPDLPAQISGEVPGR
jgi:FAD binding domain